MSAIKPGRPNPAAIQRLGEDLAAIQYQQRRDRSLQTGHRPATKPKPLAFNSNSQAYVPQASARLLNDPGLTDGARRCALKLMELIYRRNRQGRGFQCTVAFIARSLGRSERTVQTYLAQLRGRGYIRHDVIASDRARMCIGIFITLLKPLFPKHHEDEWPVSAVNSGVKKDSQNYRPNIRKKGLAHRVTVEHWALRCMDGVFRSLMKTIPDHGSFA